MKHTVLPFILIILLYSCQNPPHTEMNIAKSSIELNQFQKTELQQTDSIPELWNELVFKKGGCLGGQQYVKVSLPKRKIKNLVFSENKWKIFSAFDKTKLTQFLSTQLADTTQTKIHTCPFFNATNGEMAVYSLQQIHRKNWYDFNEFKEYNDKEYTSGTDQPQAWLLNILANDSKRMKLVDLFQNELKN